LHASPELVVGDLIASTDITVQTKHRKAARNHSALSMLEGCTRWTTWSWTNSFKHKHYYGGLRASSLANNPPRQSQRVHHRSLWKTICDTKDLITKSQQFSTCQCWRRSELHHSSVESSQARKRDRAWLRTSAGKVVSPSLTQSRHRHSVNRCHFDYHIASR